MGAAEASTWWWRPRETVAALLLVAALVVVYVEPFSPARPHASHEAPIAHGRTDRREGKGEEGSAGMEAHRGGDAAGGGGDDPPGVSTVTGSMGGGGGGDEGSGTSAVRFPSASGEGNGGGGERDDGEKASPGTGTRAGDDAAVAERGEETGYEDGGDRGDGWQPSETGPVSSSGPAVGPPPRQQAGGRRGGDGKAGGGLLPDLPPEDSRRGLRIALVANGKSTLNHDFGADIDAHDLVCRFNFFVTKNFEKKVGTRTDIWFLGQLKMPGPKGFRGTKAVGHSLMNLTVVPEKYIVPIAYEVTKSCTPKKPHYCAPAKKDVAMYKKESDFIIRLYTRYKIQREKIEILPQEYQMWLQRKYKYCHQFPSTGALSLVYLMHHFPESKVSVYGLDFLKNEIGHYWEKITKHRTIHDMKGETKFIRALQSTGRVEFKT